MSSYPNDQWEDLLDIDDFDLLLTPILCPCNRHVDEVEEKPVRIIPDPAGIVQLAKIRKQSDIYSRSGCIGDIKTFLKNGKLKQVISIIKSCSLNALGDLKVTVKDLSGTLLGSIHYKVINERGYGKEVTIGSAIILANVLVFSPNLSMYYLNITKKNMVKVFHKDFVHGNGSGVGGSEMNVIDQEDLYKFDEEALDLVLEEEARESRAHEEWLEKCRQ
uniref:Homologous recombination OB-fold protein OB-fold domain-containing protein n=1 Tax=Tanacetum cinerariifolium TaxID=118510 RepID=A0A6L2LFZ4_TANCI|nr:hypothetical protein [Tanacetum cinerariifolium]